MPTLGEVRLALIVVATAFSAVILTRRHRPLGTRGGQPPSAQPPVKSDVATFGRTQAVVLNEEPAVEPIGVIAGTTNRPNEVYLFGLASELDEFGPTLATAPRQPPDRAANRG